MSKIIPKVLKFSLWVLVIILFEGVCFRFAEDYANFRLQLAWGDLNSSSSQSLSLPLDHFTKKPKGDLSLQNLQSRILEENEYSKSILSFGRPVRDHFLTFKQNAVNPLEKFDYRNLENNESYVGDVIFPGLKRVATESDVGNNFARRRGDTLEYARAILVYLHDTENGLSKNETKNLETTFSFLLERGIACVSIPFSSAKELERQILFLKSDYPLISKTVMVCGRKKSANHIMKILEKNDDLISLAILQDPSENNLLNSSRQSTWIFGLLTGPTIVDVSKGATFQMLKMVESARISNYLYQSKIGGVLRVVDPDDEDIIPAVTLPHILKCVEFYGALKIQKEKVLKLSVLVNDLNETELKTLSVLSNPESFLETELDKNVSKTTLFQNSFIETPIQTMNAEFDCEIVRLYRQEHKDDPELSTLSNRQIVLELGKKIEKMGDQYMDDFKSTDPKFYEFYQTLKLEESTQQ